MMTLHSKNKLQFCLLIVLTVGVSILFTSCTSCENEFKAPTKTAAGWLKIKSSACYFNEKDALQKDIKIILNNPGKNEIAQIDYLMQFTGLPQNFKIFGGNISNAMATTYNNERLIIYNKNLFASLDKMDNSYWKTIFILAHEIAHHLAYNISDTADFKNAELQADKFAGTLLYNMGADSNQVIIALNSTLVSNATQRIKAAKEGWFSGYKYRYQSVTPPSIDDELTIKKFDENTLVFNSKWSDMLFPDQTGIDTSILFSNYGGAKNLKGIVLDVHKIPVENPDLTAKGFIQLKVVILITNNNKSNDFAENDKYEFDVDYEPGMETKNEKDFFNFFTEGRRLDFDVLFLSMCDGCPYNISKAKAIYNSY